MQTCYDGSVILASQTCPTPPAPPSLTCPGNSVFDATIGRCGCPEGSGWDPATETCVEFGEAPDTNEQQNGGPSGGGGITQYQYGGGGATFQPYPEFGGEYGGEFDIGQAPVIPPGGGFEDVDFGGPPAASAVGMNECSPGFSDSLPRDYADRYGMMHVTGVYCPQSNTGVGGEGSIDSIEMEEMNVEGLYGLAAVRNLG
jgi:hypothetical protein